MEKRQLTLYQALTQSLGADKGELTAQTRQNLLDTACFLLATLPTELLLKTSFSSGLSKPAAILAINSHEPDLIAALQHRLAAENLTMSDGQQMSFSPIHLTKENRVRGWKLWTEVASQTLVQKRFLTQLIEAGESKDSDLVRFLVDWYQTQDWALEYSSWSQVFKTLRGFKTDIRESILSAITHSFTMDHSMRPVFQEMLRMNDGIGLIIALRINPKQMAAYKEARDKTPKTQLTNSPFVHWIDANAYAAHGKMILQDPRLAPNKLINPQMGNVTHTVCDVLGLPHPKTWKQILKESRQKENGRTKRRVKPRRLTSPHTSE